MFFEKFVIPFLSLTCGLLQQFRYRYQTVAVKFNIIDQVDSRCIKTSRVRSLLVKHILEEGGFPGDYRLSFVVPSEMKALSKVGKFHKISLGRLLLFFIF